MRLEPILHLFILMSVFFFELLEIAFLVSLYFLPDFPIEGVNSVPPLIPILLLPENEVLFPQISVNFAAQLGSTFSILNCHFLPVEMLVLLRQMYKFPLHWNILILELLPLHWHIVNGSLRDHLRNVLFDVLNCVIVGSAHLSRDSVHADNVFVIDDLADPGHEFIPLPVNILDNLLLDRHILDPAFPLDSVGQHPLTHSRGGWGWGTSAPLSGGRGRPARGHASGGTETGGHPGQGGS